MALSIAEHLRIVGRWLDVQSASSFRLTIDANGIEIDCEDGDGRAQHRIFSESRLQRMWLLARTASRDEGERRPAHWGPALRALGQILGEQGVSPTQIWSEADFVRVATPQRTEKAELLYASEHLLTLDVAAQRRRLPVAG